MTSPNGSTPIAYAIKSAVKALKEYRASNKRIILITDGEEKCGGDYEAEAKKGKEEGIDCEIHVIGLGLSRDSEEKAKRISNISGGSYSNVLTKKVQEYNTQTIKSSLSSFSEAISKSTTSPRRNVSFQAQTINQRESQAKIRNSPVSRDVNSQSTQAQFSQKTEGNNKKETVAQKKSEDSNSKFKDTNTPNEDFQDLKILVEENSQTLNDVSDALLKLTDEIKELKREGVKISSDDSEDLVITENKELNEKVRVASEKFVFDILQKKYGAKVNWLNEKGESGADRDFEVIDDIDGSIEYYIECKGTSTNNKTFMMTKYEWRLFLNQTKNYQIFFVYNALSKPELIKVDNLSDWLLKGKIVPYSTENIKLKADRVFLTIL